MTEGDRPPISPLAPPNDELPRCEPCLSLPQVAEEEECPPGARIDVGCWYGL